MMQKLVRLIHRFDIILTFYFSPALHPYLSPGLVKNAPLLHLVLLVFQFLTPKCAKISLDAVDPYRFRTCNTSTTIYDEIWMNYLLCWLLCDLFRLYPLLTFHLCQKIALKSTEIISIQTQKSFLFAIITFLPYLIHKMHGLKFTEMTIHNKKE